MEDRERLGTETFSEREIEILRLLAEGLSNRAIAERLFLASETVKWYNKQIYTKLGVNSRTQAVAQAAGLGLLASAPTAPGGAETIVRHNLPAPLTSFVGRRQELDEIEARLRSARLLTLTGPGGSGKTRLALQTGRRMLGGFKDGVWFVDLAPLHDPAAVADAVRAALRIGELGDKPALAELLRFLATRQLLLILDNFEHLLPAAPFTSQLLAGAPRLKILATSRERLRLSGEHEYPVQPLRLPAFDAMPEIEGWLESDAIRLFVARAQAATPGFELTAESAPHVAQICARLDGLPLALELAAPRLKLFTPEDLSRQFDDLLGALAPGPRDAPERQRTLRATLDWSYACLDASERALFQRLAVFRGGATLPAVEQVCAADLSEPVATLAALVDKSLVKQTQPAGGETFFTMLETIHAYAGERLAETGAAEQTRQRHAAFYACLAERSKVEIRGPRQDVWFERLRLEMDNFRAALDWSLSGPDPEPGLRIVAGLHDFWFYVAYPSEGLHWARQAIARGEQADPALLAGVYHTAGMAAFALRDFASGRSALQQAVQRFQQVGKARQAAWSMAFLAALAIGVPEETPAAVTLAESALAILQQHDDLSGQAQALNILGELTRLDGDDERALACYSDCLTLSRQTGENLRIAMLHANLGVIANRQGQPVRAIRLIQEALQVAHQQAHDAGMAIYLAELAGPLVATGELAQAARLLGASDQILETLGTRHQPGDLQDVEAYRQAVRAALGDVAYDRLYAQGRRWSQPEAYQQALGV